MIDELGMLDITENIRSYFDYEAYGRDILINDSGMFTDNGFIVMGSGFIEHYSDIEDIPDEYRIFAFPEPQKMSMKDRLNMYQQMTSALPANDKAAPKREEIT